MKEKSELTVAMDSRDTVPAAKAVVGKVMLANSKNTVPAAKAVKGPTFGNFSRNTVPAAPRIAAKK